MDRLLCLNALRDWKGSAIFSGRVREGVPRRFESMKEDSLDYFQSERQLRPFIPVSLHLRGRIRCAVAMIRCAVALSFELNARRREERQVRTIAGETSVVFRLACRSCPVN